MEVREDWELGAGVEVGECWEFEQAQKKGQVRNRGRLEIGAGMEEGAA